MYDILQPFRRLGLVWKERFFYRKIPKKKGSFFCKERFLAENWEIGNISYSFPKEPFQICREPSFFPRDLSIFTRNLSCFPKNLSSIDRLAGGTFPVFMGLSIRVVGEAEQLWWLATERYAHFRRDRMSRTSVSRGGNAAVNANTYRSACCLGLRHLM